MAKTKSKKDVYEIVTDRIIALLEQGVVPWQKPWSVPGGGGFHRNLVSKKPYRGINVWLLLGSGYATPWWVTYKQAKTLGGQVRKGERGTPVVFWRILEKETGQTNEKGEPIVDKIPLLRYYTVFNVEQCDGLEDRIPEAAKPSADFTPIEVCGRVVDGWEEKPEIKFGGSHAFYIAGTDYIGCPKPEHFKTSEAFYSTLFHELSHSTGHKDRLNRKSLVEHDGFGGNNYSQEELVAELGASCLCGFCGIENVVIDNSAAYIKNWLAKLKDDRKLLVYAAAQAQKAADLILAAQSAEEEDEDDQEEAA